MATRKKDKADKPERTNVAELATEVDGTPKRSKADQMRQYKQRYETFQGPNGELSMDNGDDVALILRGAAPETVMRAAEKLKGLEPGTLATRYANRNNGAKRMNSGNQIRALIRNGEVSVTKLKKTIREANKEVMAAA